MTNMTNIQKIEYYLKQSKTPEVQHYLQIPEYYEGHKLAMAAGIIPLVKPRWKPPLQPLHLRQQTVKPILDLPPPPRPLTTKPNFYPTQSVKKRKRQVFKTEEEVAAASALAIAWFNLINEEDN